MKPNLAPESPDAACVRIAAGRHGVITRAEALAAGLSPQGIHRRVKSGLWKHLLPRTYVALPGPSAWHQRLAAATQWSKGIASHASAAALLGLDGYEPGAIEVSTTRQVRPPWSDLVVHRVAELPADSLVIEGIPTTSATRALVDLAADGPADRVELALEDALRRGLTSLARLRWGLSVQGCRGRRGAKLLRNLVENLEKAARITESGFEARLQQLLRRAALPTPVRQHEVRDRGKFVARADFAFPHARLIIEAVSYRWHSGRTAWTHDQTRLNAVVALGWRVLNVTWDDLRHAPDDTVDRIRRALGGSLLD